jgi:hypothetical protein
MEKPISQVTVVSALFYIGRDKWKHSAFPPGVDRYKSWVGNVLSLDANIYFFVDDFYYDFILETRKKYDPELIKTVIKKTSLTELYYYKKYFIKESCLMFSPEFRDRVFFPQSADMNYPLYHIVNFSKIEFVKQAAEENNFSSQHFFWVDAGGMREGREKYENVSWPKVSNEYFNDKVVHFSHKLEYNIYPNKDEYFRSQDRNIQGTAWIVPKEKVNTFFNMIDDQVDTIIKEGTVGSDEKVYDFLHNENKNFYQLVKCGWFEFYNVCNKVEEKKIIEIQKNSMKITAIAATWGHSDSSNFEQSNFYKSFKHFNPNREAINFHFNRGHYVELESEFNQRFGYQYEGVLYRIYLILDKIKELDTDYIITSDTQDVVCLRNVDHLIGLFDLENNVIFGMEKNDWPKKEVRDTWEGYTDFDEFHIRNSYYLNASVVLVKKDVYINFLQSIINNILPANAKDVSDQGIFSWHYNTKALPHIKLDTSSIFVVSTYNRPLEDYYMHDNKLYSNHNGIAPCFVHDNGFQWGSPQYQVQFDLYKLYS